MLEVIVNWIVLVVSPQFEMQFFVPGHEPVYINNEAPSLLFMPSNFFFPTRTPKSREHTSYSVNECIHRLVLFILLLTLKSLFHCNFSSIWTLNPIYKVWVCNDVDVRRFLIESSHSV